MYVIDVVKKRKKLFSVIIQTWYDLCDIWIGVFLSCTAQIKLDFGGNIRKSY